VPVEGLCRVHGVVEKGCEAVAGATRYAVFLRRAELREVCETHCCIKRAALAGLYGLIVGVEARIGASFSKALRLMLMSGKFVHGPLSSSMNHCVVPSPRVTDTR
jgi:hypothetical protein